jgi:hypothetical protein
MDSEEGPPVGKEPLMTSGDAAAAGTFTSVDTIDNPWRTDGELESGTTMPRIVGILSFPFQYYQVKPFL